MIPTLLYIAVALTIAGAIIYIFKRPENLPFVRVIVVEDDDDEPDGGIGEPVKSMAKGAGR